MFEKQASGRQPRHTAFWKGQSAEADEHLQKPCNAGSGREVLFFSSLATSLP
jgi:hypothetical protein